MGDFVSLMLVPFLACLVLTGMHAYLGLHVVKRGVIFVDLALAQVAALGATLAFLAGFGLHSLEGYCFSLLMTLAAAAVLSWTRTESSDVPQEAYIGIVYVVAAGAVVLVLSLAPQGGEELKSLLVGHLLFVDEWELLKTLLIYGTIALIHYRFRAPLLAISEDHRLAAQHGWRIRAWDFLFYATFGVVVTSSVELAGVLLVFSYLIVPAVCGALLATGIRARLLVGWLVGFLTSSVGIALSYTLDLPTGAAIVCVFGLCVPLCVLLKRARARIG